MKKLLILLCCVFVLPDISAQYEDAYWIAGYGGSRPHRDHGYTLFHFDRNNELGIDTGYFRYSIDWQFSSYATAEGLSVYSNGCRIGSAADFQIIENGRLINGPGYMYNNFCVPEESRGYIDWQGSVMLPHPYRDSIVGMFHLGNLTEEANLHPLALSYTEIDLGVGKGGVPFVAEKNREIAFSKEYVFSKGMTATRHANGRDWWLVVWQLSKRTVSVYLWDGDDVVKVNEQVFQEHEEDSRIVTLSQVSFSSDGTKYAAAESYDLGKLLLYDFDRCSGELGNEYEIPLDILNAGSGVCFSHSGRFLYYSVRYLLYQYDLWSVDIAGSRLLVGEFDPAIETEDPLSRYSNLWHMQRGPDGKIYIGSTNGQKHYHVVHYPELRGEACGFEQYGLRLEKYRSYGVPLYPNLHATAEAGGGCDTLGAGRAPYAKWNYRLRGDSLRVFDLSYYQPDFWEWDFGDGTVSEEYSPEHVYKQDGIYEVCLRVRNAYGEDRYCMAVDTEVTSVKEGQGRYKELKVYPNPVQEELYIGSELGGSRYELLDISGREVSRGVLSGDRLDVRGITGGVYILRVFSGGEVYVGKLVKVQ